MTVFQPSTLRRARSRGLRFEALESRLALTGMTDMVETGSLAEYLAQPPVAGPVMDEAAVAIDAAAVVDEPTDEVLDALVGQFFIDTPLPAIDPLVGEGEEVAEPPPEPTPEQPADPTAPQLIGFEAQHIDGGLVLLSGSVGGLNPAGTVVQFGGLFEGASTTCDELGNFTLTMSDPGTAGMVTASIDSTSYLSVYLA